VANNKNKIVIGSEDEAFAYLKRALENEFGDRPVQVEFKDWPVLRIKLEGKGYESTITPDMAEAIVSLQQAINRAYARVVKQENTARSLTDEERYRLQFKAKVEKGSSLLEINLGQLFETIGLSLVQKMDGTSITVTLIGITVVACSTVAYRAFLRTKAEGKHLEEESKKAVALSQEETRRMEILAKVLKQQPVVDHVRQDFDNVRQDILKGTADAKKLTVQGVTIDGMTARSIARAPRSESRAIQLNGHYRICKIDWEHADVVRLWVESTDDGRRFIATLKVDDIQERQRELLKESEWDRRSVYLSINATELRGEITTAVIVGAEWPEAPPAAQA